MNTKQDNNMSKDEKRIYRRAGIRVSSLPTTAGDAPEATQPGVEDVQAALDRSKKYTRNLYAEIQAMPLQIGSGEAVTEIGEDYGIEGEDDDEREWNEVEHDRDLSVGDGETAAERNV